MTEALADQLVHRIRWFSHRRPLDFNDLYSVAPAAWTRAQVEAAVDLLVACGTLEESAGGRLYVAERAA